MDSGALDAADRLAAGLAGNPLAYVAALFVVIAGALGVVVLRLHRQQLRDRDAQAEAVNALHERHAKDLRAVMAGKDALVDRLLPVLERTNSMVLMLERTAESLTQRARK